MVTVPPNKLLTDNDGPSARLRVEDGNSEFFSGREFRTFFVFDLDGGASLYFKASFASDTLLKGLGVQLDDGHVRLEAYIDVTAPAGFVAPLPILGANRLAARPFPYYLSQATFFTGGTFTDGTLLDVLSVKTNSNSNQASTQDAAVAGSRGLPAGDYYVKLTNKSNNSVSSGIVKARWAEQP